MANRERGELKITAGEGTYTLKLTTNACAEIEDVFPGQSLDTVLAGLKHGSVKSLIILLWAALRECHPMIANDKPGSFRAVSDLVDRAGGITGMQAQVQEFLTLNSDGKVTADPQMAQATA